MGVGARPMLTLIERLWSGVAMRYVTVEPIQMIRNTNGSLRVVVRATA
jgi:hypothetical protein